MEGARVLNFVLGGACALASPGLPVKIPYRSPFLCKMDMKSKTT